MAFIRCTSNPECLYVFDSISGAIEFYWQDSKGRQQSTYCTRKAWYELARKLGDYYEIGDEPIKTRELEVRETEFNFRTRRELRREGWSTKRFFKYKDNKHTHCQIALTISPNRVWKSEKPITIFMYPVTWRYMMGNVAEDISFRKNQ